MNNKRIIQWAFLAVIIFWGTFSLIVLAGEESADSPFTLGQFFLLKSAAAINLVGCYKSAQWLHRKGFLPKKLDDITNEED